MVVTKYRANRAYFIANFLSSFSAYLLNLYKFENRAYTSYNRWSTQAPRISTATRRHPDSKTLQVQPFCGSRWRQCIARQTPPSGTVVVSLGTPHPPHIHTRSHGNRGMMTAVRPVGGVRYGRLKYGHRPKQGNILSDITCECYARARRNIQSKSGSARRNGVFRFNDILRGRHCNAYHICFIISQLSEEFF